MAFDLQDYVDVPQRMRDFREHYPNGFLTSEIVKYENDVVVVKAYAHREPGDPNPAVGHAKEVIPGRTPYTKDSELENAETSAWGRALAALAFKDFGKVATAEEVRNRTGERGDTAAPTQTFTAPQGATPEPNIDGTSPGATLIHFGKYKDMAIAEVWAKDEGYVRWLTSPGFEAKGEKAQQVKDAAIAWCAKADGFGAEGGAGDGSDIPFMPTSMDGAM